MNLLSFQYTFLFHIANPRSVKPILRQFPFLDPRKDPKMSGFFMFSGGRERENWPEMGQEYSYKITVFPAKIYFFKVNNRNTRKMCKIRRSDVFIVHFEHISHLFLVFLLLTLNK